MSWTSKHPVELIAEWGAPVLLAGAAGWATAVAGLPLAARAAAGLMALAVGVVTMRLAGGAPIIARADFEPVPFEDCSADDELLLDDPLVETELLLDDPLVEIAPDSRVVRLFAKAEPTPGELVLRIEDYLNDSRRVPASNDAAAVHPPADASAALHAALANIRASLR